MITKYLNEVKEIAEKLDQDQIQKMVDILVEIKEAHGRLFILGVGGSAANASHAVNDFRKISGIEAYAPTDNVAELTAWTNDADWTEVFQKWLIESKLMPMDGLLILSVGGGSKTTSLNLVKAISLAKVTGSKVMGIVSRDGGYTKKEADACVLIPVVSEEHITPHAEAFQGIVWHLIANHPDLNDKNIRGYERPRADSAT